MSEYEQKRVLCEDCGQSDAVCTVAVMMGEQVMHRRLCQACMAKASMSIAAGNLGQVLGAIMAAARNAALQKAQEAQAEPEQAEAQLPELAGENPACERCGLTYEKFRTGRRLGCAGCAAAFRQPLLEMLRRDCPAVQHAGRSPLASQAAVRSRARRESLQRQLDEAIAREDYEAAAALDAALRGMNAQGEQEDE